MDQETPRFPHTTHNKVRKAVPNFAQNTPEHSSGGWINLVGEGIKLGTTWGKFTGTWIILHGVGIKLDGAWIKFYGD